MCPKSSVLPFVWNKVFLGSVGCTEGPDSFFRLQDNRNRITVKVFLWRDAEHWPGRTGSEWPLGGDLSSRSIKLFWCLAIHSFVTPERVSNGVQPYCIFVMGLPVKCLPQQNNKVHVTMCTTVYTLLFLFAVNLPQILETNEMCIRNKTAYNMRTLEYHQTCQCRKTKYTSIYKLFIFLLNEIPFI